MQNVLLILALAAALFYLGRTFYKRFFAKEHHCDGCAFSGEKGKTQQKKVN
jgi:hypothetical protein